MEIAFRVDSSVSIGTGHIVRCINVAQALEKAGHRCTFFSREHTGNLNSAITAKGFRCYPIPVNPTVSENYIENEKEWLGDTQTNDALITRAIFTANHYRPDLLFVDHYALDAEWEKRVRAGNSGLKIAVIDDLCNRAHDCDILIDTTPERSAADYANLVPAHSLALTGTKYAFLHPSFAEWRERAQRRRESTVTPGKVLITMGGIDANNITSRVLKVIEHTFCHDLELITVVLGKHCPHIASISENAARLSCQVDVRVAVDNMAELMYSHDASIGAPGGTTWERCVLGLPAINIAVANNQLTIINALREKGFITCDKPDFSDRALLVGWQELKERYHQIAMTSFSLCDGRGLERVISRVSNFLNGKGDKNTND